MLSMTIRVTKPAFGVASEFGGFERIKLREEGTLTMLHGRESQMRENHIIMIYSRINMCLRVAGAVPMCALA